jgi:hypothetical protein
MHPDPAAVMTQSHYFGRFSEGRRGSRREARA